MTVTSGTVARARRARAGTVGRDRANFPEVEDVVEENDRYAVVENRGEAAAVVRAATAKE